MSEQTHKEFVDLTEAPGAPDSQDTRSTFPNCIATPRWQSTCGGCYAFSAAGTLGDRQAIQNRDKNTNACASMVELAPEEIIMCNSSTHVCNGGWLDVTWEFLQQNGIVNETCMPFPLTYNWVSQDSSVYATCPNTCKNNSPMSNRLQSTPSVGPLSGVAAYQTEILKNGPIQVAFQVYADLQAYSSGVYQPTTDVIVGLHAVEIVGWGKQDGEGYWIVKNSWSCEWGMEGQLLITWDNDITNYGWAAMPVADGFTSELSSDYASTCAANIDQVKHHLGDVLSQPVNGFLDALGLQKGNLNDCRDQTLNDAFNGYVKQMAFENNSLSLQYDLEFILANTEELILLDKAFDNSKCIIFDGMHSNYLQNAVLQCRNTFTSESNALSWVEPTNILNMIKGLDDIQTQCKDTFNSSQDGYTCGFGFGTLIKNCSQNSQSTDMASLSFMNRSALNSEAILKGLLKGIGIPDDLVAECNDSVLETKMLGLVESFSSLFNTHSKIKSILSAVDEGFLDNILVLNATKCFGINANSIQRQFRKCADVFRSSSNYMGWLKRQRDRNTVERRFVEIFKACRRYNDQVKCGILFGEMIMTC